MTKKVENKQEPLQPSLDIADVRQSFSVFAYTVVTDDMHMYCHWSEGLNMVIKKDGIEIKLNGEELKQLVASLPRTFGGSY